MKSTALFLICLSLAAAAPAQEKAVDETIQLSDADKLYWLGLLWSEAKYNFVYFDQVPDLDWDAAYREFIPKMLATTNELEFYRTLQAFMALLKDGHTYVLIPGHIRERFDQPPLNVQEIEGLPVVTSVARELSEDIPLGSVVLAVDGIDSKQFIQESVYPYIGYSTAHFGYDYAMRGAIYPGVGLLMRDAGSKIVLKLRKPDGQLVEREVTCNRSTKEDIDLVSAFQQTEQGFGPLIEEGFTWRWLEEGILYVALNNFRDPKIIEEFKAILPEVEKAKGVMFDIRFNGSGNVYNGIAILDYFTDSALVGYKWKTREHRGTQYAWGRNPENEYHDTYGTLNAWYEGDTITIAPTEGPKFFIPVVVLIDYFTGSVAEEFLVFTDQLDRFTLVGRPTMSTTGQPILYMLPGGGRALICAKRDTYPDGREFVGYGIQPDVPVAPTIRSIAEGIDAVLGKGLEVLKVKIAEQ